MTLQVFDSVLIFDGVIFQPDTRVVTDGSLIVAVGPASGVEIPGGADVIDCTGKTLLPGFIDSHVHIGFFDPKIVLRGGVTTVRDLGWSPDRIFALSVELDRDPASGPKLLAAGGMLTAPGGYPVNASWAPPGTAIEIHDASEASSAVRSMIARGASVIKVAQEPRQGPVLEPETLAEIVKTAHDSGLEVTSHVGSLAQLEIAIEAGIDELAHGLWSNERIPDDLISEMVSADMTLIPTLHIDPSPERIDGVRRFHEARGRVIYGTDMGNTGPPPGLDAKELRLMMEAGMSLEETLGAATRDVADHLGLNDRGRIESGHTADLIFIDGDPREDLESLSHPAVVMRDGLTSSR